VFAVVFTGSVFVVGVVSDRVSHKFLLLLGMVLIMAGMACFIFLNWFGTMLLGFALIGMGHSVFTVVPYIQVKLFAGDNARLYDRWYFIIAVSFIISSGGGRFLMMLSTIYVTNSFLNWRLPWIVAGCMLGLSFWLTLMFASFYSPSTQRAASDAAAAASKQEDSANSASSASASASGNGGNGGNGGRGGSGGGMGVLAGESRYSYREKVSALYCNPISFIMLVGTFFVGYAMYAVGIWAPTLAFRRFPSLTEEELNFSISATAVVASPAGILINGYLLVRAKKMRSAVRICWGSVLVGGAVMVVFSAVKNFVVFCGTLLVFTMVGSFPEMFYKQLPFVLGFPPEIALFAVSRFALVYSLSGDIAGSLLTGILLDEVGTDTTIWILVGSVGVALALWSVNFAWSFMSSGPIAERAQAQDKEEAQRRWRVLQEYTYKRASMARVLRAMANQYFGWSQALAALLSANYENQKAVFGEDSGASASENSKSRSGFSKLKNKNKKQGAAAGVADVVAAATAAAAANGGADDKANASGSQDRLVDNA
jgi:MFS family permease